MIRRYLKRIKPLNTEKSSERKKSSIELDPEDEILMAFQEQERILTFGRKPQPKSPSKRLREETRNALDAAGNTGQHLKYFNYRLAQHISQIEKIKKVTDKFEHDIEKLQSYNFNNFETLSKKPFTKLNTEEIKKLRTSLPLQKDFSKSELDYFENKIKKAKEELKRKQIQLDEINKMIQKKKLPKKRKQQE